MRRFKKGFTLMELLIVMAIIGILSTTLVVAINPARQFAKARDTERETDLHAIVSAILQYSAEHSGELPDTDGDPDTSNFPTSETCIGTDTVGGCFDLGGAGDDTETIVPDYLPNMPTDPETGTQEDTGYTIYVDANDRIIASASGETREIGIKK